MVFELILKCYRDFDLGLSMVVVRHPIRGIKVKEQTFNVRFSTKRV